MGAQAPIDASIFRAATAKIGALRQVQGPRLRTPVHQTWQAAAQHLFGGNGNLDGNGQGIVILQDGNLLFWSGPIRRNYNVADFDRTRNYEQTITYELPAGRGHDHFNSGIVSLSRRSMSDSMNLRPAWISKSCLRPET